VLTEALSPQEDFRKHRTSRVLWCCTPVVPATWEEAEAEWSVELMSLGPAWGQHRPHLKEGRKEGRKERKEEGGRKEEKKKRGRKEKGKGKEAGHWRLTPEILVTQESEIRRIWF
jgi:hypothetical protein